MVTLALSGGAEARHYRYHYGHHGGQSGRNVSDEVPHDSGPASPLGTLMTQFIQDCERQVLELKHFPMDAIAESAAPDDSQNDALKEARHVADGAAERLAAACPKDVPPEPAARLDVMERGVDAVEAALSAMQPPLQAFYDLLSDDQKHRLEARFVTPAGSKSPLAETTGSTGRALTAGHPRRHRRGAEKAGDAGDTSPAATPATQEWDCEQWQAELRAWPIERMEQVLTIGPRQRAAFYAFVAALQRAADALADSCAAETASTPIGRIGERIERLEALRHSVATIQPALGQLYEALNGDQRIRFSDAL